MKEKNDATGETVTPSQKAITADQINKAVANYRAMLERYAHEFQSEPTQIVLDDPELAVEQHSVLRKRIEAISGMIVRTVKVDRSLSPKQVLDATGRVQYTDDSVVAEMPRGECDEVQVRFFKIGRPISNDELEKEYELRGLVPADGYSVAKVNQDDPTFADTNPNGTHWKNSKGKWCYAYFDRWFGDKRYVDVYLSDHDWYGDWWFAGFRKQN